MVFSKLPIQFIRPGYQNYSPETEKKRIYARKNFLGQGPKVFPWHPPYIYQNIFRKGLCQGCLDSGFFHMAYNLLKSAY